MADRVELIVQLSGDQNALRSLSDLKRVVDGLKGTKIDLQIEQHSLKRQIDQVSARLKELKSLSKFGTLSEGDAQEYAALDRRLQDLKRSYADVTDQIRQYGDAVRAGTDSQRGMTAEIEASISTIERLGNAIQSLGNISQLTKDFAVGIGEAFSDMSGMFSLNVFDKIGTRLTELFTDAFVGDMGKIVSRYDIMSTFTQYMNLAGAEADEAAEALQRVNNAILGLPIGLDESAQRLRRYQMFLGDLDKATDLTIGLQNAIYAGGANEQMRTTAFYQIDRLLSVGKLNSARQWNALIQGLGVSMRFVAEEMGLGYDSVDKFAQGLTDGSISTDAFLSALMRLGEGQSEAAQRLNEALSIYKGTVESWLSNIRFAAVRGGETILKAMEASLNEGTGKGVTGYLKSIRDGMNDVYAAMGNWIKANPEALSKNIAAFEGLINALGRFDAGNIATGVFDNIARGVNMLTDALNKLPTDDVEQFFTFATTLAGPIGKVFSAVSSGAGVMLGVFERFKDFDFEGLFDKIIRNVEILANAVEGLLNLLPDGVMSELLAFGLVFGGPVSSALSGLGSIVLTLASHMEMLAISSGTAATALSTATASLASFLAVAAPIAAVTAAVVALGIAFKGLEDAAVRKYKAENYTDIDVSGPVRAAENLRTAWERTETSLKEGLVSASVQANEIEQILTKLGQNDTAIRNRTMGEAEGLAAQTALIKQLDAVWSGHNAKINETNGLLDQNTLAMARNAKSVADRVRNESRVKAYETAYADALQTKIESEVQYQALLEKRKELEDAIEDAEKDRMGAATADWYGANENIKFKAASKSLEEYRAELDEVDEKIAEVEETHATAAASVDVFGNKIEETSQALRDGADAVADYAELHSQRIAAIGEAYDELKQKASESFAEQIKGFDGLSKASGATRKSLTDTFEEEKKQLEEYYKNLEYVIEYLQQNPELGGTAFGAKLSEAMDIGNRSELEVFANILRDAANGNTSALDKWQKLFEDINGLNTENLEAVGKMLAAGDLGGLLGFMMENPERLSELPEELQKMVREMQHLTESQDINFGKMLTGTDATEAETRAEEVKDSVKAVGDAALEGAEEAKAKIESSLEESGTILEAAAGVSEDEVEELKTEITKKLEEIGTVAGEQAEAFAQAIADEGSDKSMVGGLAKFDEMLKLVMGDTLPQFSEAINTLGQQVDTFTNTALENLRTKANETTDAIDKLREAIEKLANTMQAKIGTVNAFASSIAALRDMVNAATQEVLALKAAIDSLEDKTVTITVNTVGGEGLEGGGEGGGASGDATGGLITGPGPAKYYAKGGSVFDRLFKPVGTDTVPAMLTPGEYIMRKGAVDRLGVPFLQKLNRLDLAGAIDNLMHRFYRPSSAAYSVVNQSTDNRSYAVTQYIETNNPDFTFRSASRFAHAL